MSFFSGNSYSRFGPQGTSMNDRWAQQQQQMMVDSGHMVANGKDGFRRATGDHGLLPGMGMVLDNYEATSQGRGPVHAPQNVFAAGGFGQPLPQQRPTVQPPQPQQQPQQPRRQITPPTQAAWTPKGGSTNVLSPKRGSTNPFASKGGNIHNINKNV